MITKAIEGTTEATKTVLKEAIDMDVNDKNLVIICATAIALVSLSILGEPALGLAANVVSGMFGVAVGKTMNKP